MTQRDRLLVSGLVFLVLGGLLWFMLVSPKREEATKLDEQIVVAQSDLNSANAQNAAAAEARRNYGLDVAAVKALKKALPDDDQTAQLLYQLNAAAGSSNVK
jgi:Tfp pilus assembly protein PilO